jgi:ribosomal-protein-alanine N-acetyltransferase
MLQIQLTPFQELTTQRCRLRQITLEDTNDILEINSDPEVMRYLDRESLRSPKEAEFIINMINEDIKRNAGIWWGITLHNDNKVIGMIGFWRMIAIHHRAEIGFMLLPAYWNTGLMSEAIQAVVDHGFNQINLHSIEANVNPKNLAAQKLLQKNGFVQEGYFRENYYFDGKFIDSVTFSLIKTK